MEEVRTELLKKTTKSFFDKVKGVGEKITQKPVCARCREETKYGDYFSFENDRKFLCSSCQQALHISGYDGYRYSIKDYNYDLKNAMSYSKYYNNIVSNKASFVPYEERGLCLVNVIGDLIINDCFTFDTKNNMVISNKDVFAVCIDSVPQYSGPSVEVFTVSLFTCNKNVPLFTTMESGRCKFFSLSLKAKKTREILNEILCGCYPNLRYPISSARKIDKEIKNDECYPGAYDKSKMSSVLLDARSNSSAFNKKKLANSERLYFEEGVRLNLEMGYAFPLQGKRGKIINVCVKNGLYDMEKAVDVVMNYFE